MKYRCLLSLVAILSAACGDDDASPLDAGRDDGATEDGATEDGGLACAPREPSAFPDPGACVARADDFAQCTDDGWSACVSDSGEYTRIQDSISTIARVRAYESIATLLFDPTRDPTAEDFLDARAIYQEDEGLDSRVVRRYDVNVSVPDGTDCTLDGVPAMFPEYCIGPSTLQPALLDAFARGAMDEAPTRLQAARIEGTLLRFLAVSVTKESLTCTTAAKDCDSAYAYYTGGETALGETMRGGIGLAGVIAEVDPYAHDRVWDGILAVRCWRDLDPAETATNTTLRDRARAQVARALTDGAAAIVAARLRVVATTSGDEQAYHWTMLQSFAPYLLPFYSEASASDAAALETALESATPPADAVALADAIDATFACP